MIRGGAIEQLLLVGAGFLAAPMVSNLIPFTPQSKLGEYLKKAAAVTVGSTVAGKVFGKKFGNALLLGGMINVGVDVLREYVPALGGSGVGAYFPTNAEIAALTSNGMTATGLMPESAGIPGRWAPRGALPSGVMGSC